MPPEQPTTSDRLVSGASTLLVVPFLGVVVGLAMGLIRYLAYDVMWASVVTAPWWVMLALPVVGLALSGLLLSRFADDPLTHDSEAYIAAYHRGAGDRARTVAVKIAAALTTIGAGGVAGLEGPAVHLGSAFGERTKRLLRRSGLDVRVLMAAGAAAGISGIFKTPLTGVLFALEVPYKDDVAREALVPALVSSVTSYLTVAAVFGPEPLFPVARAYRPDLRGLVVAVLLGLFIGLVARGFVMALAAARRVSERISPPLPLRAAGGGLVVGIVAVASIKLFASPIAIGTGYEAIDAVTAGRIVGGAALALFAMRVIATVATLGSGAAGGSFLPLIALGATAGGALQPLLPRATSLPPIVGMAAFLAAGYGTPLTASIFVAESTGSPGYIIPGVIAAAVAYVVSGRESISHLQRQSDRALLRVQLEQPVSALMSDNVVTVTEDTSLEVFVREYVVGFRRKSFPVAKEQRLLGMVSLTDVGRVPEGEWATTRVGDVMETSLLTARTRTSAREVLADMERRDLDRVPVVDEDGQTLLGIVSLSDLRPSLKGLS
jgi:chloride channel protein, CIC family